VHREVTTSDGTTITKAHYQTVRDEELSRLLAAREGQPHRLQDAAALLDRLVLNDDFTEFLTVPGYGTITTFTRTKHTPSGGSGPMSFTKGFDAQVDELKEQWAGDRRWRAVARDYAPRDVVKLRGTVRPDYTIARLGAERLWAQLHSQPYVHTFGALTGSQAVQMVRAGLQAIYLSGWQVAADGNLAAQTYPDQSLYPSNSVPALVKRLNNALMRADQIEWAESGGRPTRAWMVPIVADAEAGFGGPLHAYELTRSMIEAGAAGVHFEDQLASEKKCGHMGGKVLVPTSQMVRTLQGARLAADVCGVPTLIIARTDALAATLITSDVDDRDRPFLTGERTAEGYYLVKPGMGPVIARALAYAPYVDLLWCETGKPDLEQARAFAEAVHEKFPGKMLAYNCSPSFNWTKNLSKADIARFQRELGAMGYKFQFITLAGWHMINLNAFELAHAYRTEGMPAYVRIQDQEFAREADGYTATKHQREAGTGYFDEVLTVITGGQASTAALKGSTEEEQFHGDPVPAPLGQAGSGAPASVVQ
jgi:isocitrate lyase